MIDAIARLELKSTDPVREGTRLTVVDVASRIKHAASALTSAEPTCHGGPGPMNCSRGTRAKASTSAGESRLATNRISSGRSVDSSIVSIEFFCKCAAEFISPRSAKGAEYNSQGQALSGAKRAAPG